MSKVWLSKNRRNHAALSLALAVVVTVLALFGAASPAKAAPLTYSGNCQCTQYVSNVYNLTGFPNAYQWGSYLQGKGWYQDGGISVGDIIVFAQGQQIWVTNPANGASFYWYTDPNYGHVAIVQSLVYHRLGPYWIVTFQGANQGVTPNYTSYSCTNVTTLQFDADGSAPGSYVFYHHP